MQWANGDGRSQWFEASGVGRQTGGGMPQPVPGAVTSNYGLQDAPDPRLCAHASRARFPRRPTARRSSPSTDGTVSRAGWAGGYGNQVRLNHAGGLATSYSHMSRIAVAPGARVRQGQVIGYVGSTGLSTGPHLHFEIYRNGVDDQPALGALRRRARSSSRQRPRRASARRLRGLLGTPVGAAQAQQQAAQRRHATARR